MLGSFTQLMVLGTVLLMAYFLRLQFGILFSGGKKSEMRAADGYSNRYLVISFHLMSIAILIETLRRIVFYALPLGVYTKDYYLIYWILLFALIQLRNARPEPSKVIALAGILTGAMGILVGWAFWFPHFS